MATLLLVDIDDPALAAGLQAAGHAVALASVATALLADPSPDVALVRAGSGPVTSLALKLSAQAPATAWVVVLPAGAAEQAPSVLDAGASDVVLEPVSPAAVRVLVDRLLREKRAKVRLDHLERDSAREGQLADVIGDSTAMRELLEKVSRISRRSAFGPALSVTLSGETGTGKGLLARVLHYSSRRRDRPFIEVNCAAIPATLLESELFGHERGAFTDAKTARVGLLEAADGGTLFLDEVSYLTAEGQAKLLTVLETRRVRRLGASAERQVDVQIVAASSHDLDALAASGGFKPELLHRLAALWFKLPALRERADDAVLLAERFLERTCASYRLPRKALSEEARAAIRAYPWPGNVRELAHAIERAVLAEEGDQVAAADLSLPARAPPPAAPPGAIPPEGLAAIDGAERELIERALRQEKGNVTRAAALLRVSRDVLRSRVEKHGLDPAAYAAG
ncbi:MAG: sigma 54-interacting transcriptional regulator [Myxococcaceae bacterium]